MATKEQALRNELALIEKKKEQKMASEKSERLLKDFLRRPSCALTGKAHFAESLTTLGISVSVPGNCGETYKGPIVTEAVRIYFHNVWPYDMRAEFSKKLNAFVEKEMQKVMGSPVVVLELMGLSRGLLDGMDKAAQEKAMASIREEQFAVLDKIGFDKVKDVKEHMLCHSRSILADYLKSRKK